MYLAIIPARSGSKRIPNKNIKFFINKPIISYSIVEAKKSKLFREIIVSTDSNKVKRIVNKYGAKVYYLRSKKLSDDFTPIKKVLIDILVYLKKKFLLTEYFCLIYATAPLISKIDLQKSLRILINSSRKVDSVLAVTKFNYPIQRALEINRKGFLTMINNKYKYHRSQDLKNSYHDAGVFAWFKTDNFLRKIKKKNIVTLPYVLSDSKVQDIDTIEDWKISELKYKFNKKIKK